MADTREMRMFTTEQLEVPKILPEVLKELSKEVILKRPENIYKFAKEFFEEKLKERGEFVEPEGL